MDYLIRLTEATGRHVALLTLSEAQAKKSAIDVVFELVGADDVEALVGTGVLAEAHVDELTAIQALVFDADAEGRFIRDGVSFTANGQDLEPDDALPFTPIEREGMRYMRCELAALPPGATASAPAEPEGGGQDEAMRDFAGMMLLHQIALGRSLDVTKDYPDMQPVIEAAERQGHVEIDIEKAVYKLTATGKRQHETWIDEAQTLIKKYDIYGDVAVDSAGTARFDTGMGEDWRVAAFELGGYDPFKARFLLGLSDGEWNDLPDWHLLAMDPEFYGEIFAPIETAPGLAEVGRDRLLAVVDQAQARLRQDGVNF